jgi:hypothetical protein
MKELILSIKSLHLLTMIKNISLFILLFVGTLGNAQQQFTQIFSTALNGEINIVYDDTLNGKLYVGGEFVITGEKNYLLCVDRNTGAIINTFAPNITSGWANSVSKILVHNGVVYFSGRFTQVGGQTRSNYAAVDANTGALLSWYPNIGGSVDCWAVYNNNILIGGGFVTVNGLSRPKFASISTTGVVNSYSINVLGSTVEDIIVVNHNIYLAGYFIQVNGQNRMGVAKVNAVSGVLNSWNPNPDQTPTDIEIYKNRVYFLGGAVSTVGGQNQKYMAVVDTINGNLITNNANVFLPDNDNWQYFTSTAEFAVFADTVITVANDFTNDRFWMYGAQSLLAGVAKIGNLGTSSALVCGTSEFEFVKGNGKRLYSSYRCYGTYHNSPGNRVLMAYCPLPKLSNFTTSTSTLCAGTKNVNYSIPATNYVDSYLWTYSGTGATITQNNNSVSINFSNSATSGTLSVQLVSNCNSTVRKVTTPITVNPIPSVNAGPDLTSNCTNNKVVILNGSSSVINNEWTGPSSFYNNNLSIPVINPAQGNYILSSTITATGCNWRDTAYVAVDTLKPNLTMPVIANTRLCCTNPSVNLYASSLTSGVTYTWSNNNGYTSNNPAIINTTSPVIPVNNMTYSLTIKNPNNGCVNNGSITLLLDTVHPTFGLGVSTVGAKISCIATSASINGISGVSKAKLYWNGGSLPSNSPNPATVTIPTTYTLMANDTVNGCKSYVNYAVLADTAKPHINPLPASKYRTCDTNQVKLNATSPSVNTTFTWTPPIGATLPNPSFVTNSGNYTLNAIDVTNGCSRTRNLLVIVDTLKPNLTTNVDSVKLSCSVLSYSLNANSTSSPVTINWSGIGGYTSLNPATITNQGFYTATIKNTFNGCNTSKLIKVSIDSTKPYIIPFSNNFQINCSYTTAILIGATIPSTKFVLSWQGSSGFNSTNPAIVKTAGTYTFTALDTVTGCQSIKVVNLNYQPNLVINAGNDTTICFGSSANLKVSSIGGTPSFNYTWSNGGISNSTIVTPNNTASYIVTVSDNAGCIGKDTVLVIVPALIQDSSKTFLPCDPNFPFGQIQTYPYGGMPPYQFAVGSGTFQTSNVFANLPLDTYTINIKDNLGCTKSSTVSIDNSSLRPEPNFLITTNMSKTDTFVVVDISNPRPDSVQWVFPPTCSIINYTNPFSPIIINSDTGMFVMNLKAFFGTCEMNKSKLVHIGKIDPTLANSFNNKGIESITLYPNPNSGQFNVEVKLFKKQTFAILIYDASGIEKYRQTINESSYFNQLINMSPIATGPYILKVVAQYDAKQKAFIISQ